MRSNECHGTFVIQFHAYKSYWTSLRVHPVGISFSDVIDDWISCQTALSLHLTSNQPPLLESPSLYPGKHVKRTMFWWVALLLEAVALATVGTAEPHVRAERHTRCIIFINTCSVISLWKKLLIHVRSRHIPICQSHAPLTIYLTYTYVDSCLRRCPSVRHDTWHFSSSHRHGTCSQRHTNTSLNFRHRRCRSLQWRVWRQEVVHSDELWMDIMPSL